jgi:hypothetical protein
MAAIKNVNDVKIGMVFMNTKTNENVGVTAVDSENGKVTFALVDGSSKELSFSTVKRWYKFVSEAPVVDEPAAAIETEDDVPFKEGDVVETTVYGPVTVVNVGKKAVTFKFVNPNGYDEEQTLMIEKLVEVLGKVAENKECEDCGGDGWTVNDAGEPVFCGCEAGKKRKEEANKKDKEAANKSKATTTAKVRRGRKRSAESIETFCLELLKAGGTVSGMADALEEILKEKKIKFTDAKMRVRRAIYYCEKESPGFKLTKDNSNGRGNTIYKLVEKK